MSVMCRWFRSFWRGCSRVFVANRRKDGGSERLVFSGGGMLEKPIEAVSRSFGLFCWDEVA